MARQKGQQNRLCGQALGQLVKQIAELGCILVGELWSRHDGPACAGPDPGVAPLARGCRNVGQFGFWNFSTNSSTGTSERKIGLSRGSSGWRRKSPSATSRK